MRVMVIVKATKESETGVMPPPKLLADMGKFNEELMKAGVMLDGAGLRESSKGARVCIPAKEGAGRAVSRGATAGSNDLIAGYWVWKVKDLDEAIEWVKKCPSPSPGVDTEVEIRPLFEEADFA